MNDLYLNINVRVTIGGKVQFRQVKSVETTQSIEALADTAKIELPREFRTAKMKQANVSLEGKNILDYIKVGDAVVIEAGYNDDFHAEFEGYITEVGADIPLLLVCEDEMYQLKNKPLINHTFASVDLKTLLDFICPEYEKEVLDIPLGKMMIERSTPFKVIEELKKQYGIHCVFNGKKMRAGFKTDVKADVIHSFVFNKNFRKSNDLKYKTKQDRKTLLKAQSSQSGTSQKVTYEYGEQGGGERTLHAPMNLSLSELKEFTEKIHHSSVFDGYEGTIEGFGYPRTKAGDTVQLTDPNYTDGHRNGLYLLEGVTILINENEGFKRKNNLSLKLANTKTP